MICQQRSSAERSGAQRGDVEVAAEALLQPLQLRLELEACANQLEQLWRFLLCVV